jgi:predicted RNase H-like nuclease (RuvC/YqgF family)
VSSVAPEPLESSPAWHRLEEAVRRITTDRSAWRDRALAAEDRVRELESALRDVAAGKLDPVALSARSRQLEAENRSLNQRLDQARETVDRIMARLQFTQEEP